MVIASYKRSHLSLWGSRVLGQEWLGVHRRNEWCVGAAGEVQRQRMADRKVFPAVTLDEVLPTYTGALTSPAAAFGIMEPGLVSRARRMRFQSSRDAA